MSYVVLARRYRPQKFSDLLGQEHVAVTLKNALQAKRTSHAYLFTGPRGVGKTSAARILAKALRCLEPQDGEPCNQCASCTSINDGSSVDVLEIDAASNTGVENIRDLRETVGYVAQTGSYRVYIIDEVHMLSVAAFNALLKTLEEPPPHVVFIFATTELHKVLPTIQSRCQRFDFKKIRPDVMLQALTEICKKESVKIDPASLQTITMESDGCLRDAQSLLDQAIAFCGADITTEKLSQALGLLDRAAFFDLLQCLARHDASGALERSQVMFNKGIDPKVLLTRLVESLRQLHFKAFTQKTLYPDPENDALLDVLLRNWSPDEVVRAMDLSLRAQSSLYTTSNPLILVESLLVRLCLQRPVTNTASPPSPSSPNTSSGSSSESRTTSARTSSWKLSEKSDLSDRPGYSAQSHQDHSSQALNAPLTATSGAAVKTTSQIPVNSVLASWNSPEPTIKHTPLPMAEASAAKPATPTPASPQRMGSSWRAPLEDFIRSKRPAWSPVLQSILEIVVQGDTLEARCKPDFAGKRLASADGIEVLKMAYGVRSAKVSLQTTASTQSSAESSPNLDRTQLMNEKKRLSKEHEAVKAAMSLFDARIVDTKIF